MATRQPVRTGGTARVLPTTRVLSAVIVPFLVAAWWILFLLPEETERLFAWPVRPTMTAMTLGAVYIGGAYFFVRAVAARSWERVALGFLPVAGFATLMGLATILHWDRFTSGHMAFTVWVALYFTTPFLVVAAWLGNRREAPAGVPAADDGVMLSRRARAVAGLLGAVALVLGLALFAWPDAAVAVWPWDLTPLTARVMAAIFVLAGAGIGVARDGRWRSVRLLVHVVWVMIGLTLVATARAWDELDSGSVLTGLFVAWLVGVLAGSAVLYAVMERRSGARAPAAPPPR